MSRPQITRCLLSLGSNLEPEQHLRAAARELRAAFPGIMFSPVLRYAAVGFEGPDFFNAAAMLDTLLTAPELSDWLHALEDRHGRRRDVPRFSSRTLDVDLVLYGDLICNGPGRLRLPRPDLVHAFVLEPLAMLAPDFIEPLSGQSLQALWQAHPDHARPAEVQAFELHTAARTRA